MRKGLALTLTLTPAVLLVLALCSPAPGSAAGPADPGPIAGTLAPGPADPAAARGEDERLDGFYTLLSPEGRALLQLGLRVHPGDRFLSEDNVWYEVSGVQDLRAQLKRLPEPTSESDAAAPAVAPAVAPASPAPAPATPVPAAPAPPAQPAAGGTKIGIYHTHSDESYTPSDGQSNIPEHGGIYQVGAAFRDALVRLGYSAVQDLTAHDPHDGGAYGRSRRTALNLLKGGATAIFDVHRDTAPAEAYRRTIDGQDVTQVMIVVGRDNPTLQATLGFATALKNAADAAHPHLIRGIFMGEGGYNQDLTPRALLFEVGSYTNRREEAEAGIRLLADVMPAVLGPPTAPQAVVPPTPQERSGYRSALAWLAALAVIGGGGFLLLAAGGLRPAWERLRLLGREFNDLWPRRRNRT